MPLEVTKMAKDAMPDAQFTALVDRINQVRNILLLAGFYGLDFKGKSMDNRSTMGGPKKRTRSSSTLVSGSYEYLW